MGDLKAQDVQNVDIARRTILVSPPEPPADYLMADPKDSIYIGRTDFYNVPFYWTFKRLINPHVAITGVTGSGKSGEYPTPVIVRRDGKVSIEKIGALVDNLILKKGIEQIEDCEGVSDPEIEVYAFDENLKGKWSKVKFAGRKSSPEVMYKFKTTSGREITTTGDHNIVILKKGNIEFRKSTEVSPGDYLPIPREVKIDSNIQSYDVPLSKELMRLVGYFVSEGSLINDKDIRIYNMNKRILDDVLSILRLFGKPSLVRKKGKGIIGVRIRSNELLSIFRSLNILRNSATKRAPSISLFINKIFLGEYFKAYYEGDGCAEKNCITAVTKSRELANDHLYLLLRFGIIGRLRKVFKRATNAKHKGDWYYNITISGHENIEKFAQIGFVSPEKNKKLFELLKKKPDTNVDVIPEISGVVKKIYQIIKFDRSSMTDFIGRGMRNPSRNYLNILVEKINERKNEIKNARKEVEQLRNLPRLSALIETAQEKEIGSVLYKEMDESWRRAKKGLVKTKLRNVNRIAEIVDNKFYLQKEELKNAFIRVFSVLRTGLQSHGNSIYDFCTGRREDITYEKIEKTAGYLVGRYDELYYELSKIEKDIEFLELLANSDLFWDPIVSIEKVKSKHPYVYDLCVDDEVFLAGYGGLFVHNSYFIKTFLLRASLVTNANAIIIDWAGEYKAWVKQVGGKVIALAKGSYINLLDLAGMKPSNRAKQVIRSLEILTDIEQYPEQRRLTEQAIEEAYVRAGFKLAVGDQKDALGNPLTPPTLKDVQKILQEKLETGSYEFPAELENAIYKIKKFTLEGDDYFAEQSTIDLDTLITSGLVAIDLSGLPDETFRALGALTILQFIKEKMRMEGWKPEKGVKLWVVLDEAWKISKDENSDAVMIVREGRKYQFGLIVASQTPTDISEVIFSNVGTVFALRLKYEKYLDYLQNTLRFSDYIRERVLRFGVGQAAVSMYYAETVPFSETFLLRKIDGEEPIIDYFVDIKSILTEAQRRDVSMAKSFSKERFEFKKRLREMGLSDERVEEISKIIEREARHIDAVDLVIELERRGIIRKAITTFFRELGIDDSTTINIFTRADQKRTGLTDRDVTQVILE